MRKAKITELGREMLSVIKDHRKRRGVRMPRLIKTPVKLPNGETAEHLCCSLCLEVIEESWDHFEGCTHFVDEPLNKFLKEGLKNE